MTRAGGGIAGYHEVLATEDDPEGEQHRVEDALPDVSEEQHPGPVEADGEPLHWDVDERHGDPESEDYPERAETPRCYTILLSINKTPVCTTEEHLDESAGSATPGDPFCTCVIGWWCRLNLGPVLGRFYTSTRRDAAQTSAKAAPSDREMRAQPGHVILHQLAIFSVLREDGRAPLNAFANEGGAIRNGAS